MGDRATLRQQIQAWVTDALAQSAPTAWFETLYAAAAGDSDQVPWAGLQPHPLLQDWLTSSPTPGRALVVGCGLGDDAEALQKAGWQVTAFDIAPTAIAWCHQRFPQSAVQYVTADLLAPDPSWRQSFDLVLESRTIQSLPLTARSRTIQAIGALVAPGGLVLVITNCRPTEAPPSGPPWPLSATELATFNTLGFATVQYETFPHTDTSTVVRAVYQRPAPGAT